MRVVVDTPIWSLALRRQSHALNPVQRVLKNEWTELIREGRAVLLGPVRQELLTGIRDQHVFHRLRERLRGFDDSAITGWCNESLPLA